MDMLKTKAEFDFIYKKGFYRHSKEFVLYVYRDKILDSTSKLGLKLGLSVSKKVGNAVKRNLIKRRIKALFQEFEKTLSLIGCRIVFVAKEGVYLLSFQDLRKNILDCLSFVLHKLGGQKI
ncbi:ribonuclease P protein component [Helicobacter fennelliae]|uniref:Ribonuclease P protein component n=3 Tax=Helicobacter fennelliae TaxID=215 RepID=T1DV08_9HELI|nr:ribonuclease P protein component [Helicobacter fennelliae]GAD18343.1 ribonuclease P protein component [Helicobacter fennelliae MRY12-0050]SQB97734.1 ribonuclease P protein component [Helicobacter fennelliae]STP06897.1 ribonuclease P protein component [Helicobacter fennelliae]